MNNELAPGSIIKTLDGGTIKVDKELGRGGQGIVYKVNYNGVPKALKWYFSSSLKKPDKFYDNLKNNVNKKAPANLDTFLWPQALTERKFDSFGYIMDIRPPEYQVLTKYMLTTERFDSFKAAVEACIQIVNAYRLLHKFGYSYQDLNDGNFFVNPHTGKVLICDNDNVAPNGTVMGVIGKPRYMAPEIVTGKSMPNVNTDNFSMSLVLFIILCLQHPLEGSRWANIPCLTPQDERKIYGEDPVFVCDPKDKSNIPAPCQKNVGKLWGFLPDYVRDTFIKAFCKDAMQNPSHRVSELEWMKVFVRFRSEIYPCTCGKNEIFLKNGKSTICEKCRKTLVIEHHIIFPLYTMGVREGARIYRCQLGICNPGDELIPVAVVQKDETGEQILKNKSHTNMVVTTPSGKKKVVAHDERIPFRPGLTVEVFSSKFSLD